MFTRHCFKIASSSRAVLYRQFSETKKYLKLSYLSRCSNLQNARLFSSIVNTKDVKKHASHNVNNIENIKNSRDAFKDTSLSSEELLEKLIAGLSKDIHQKNRVYKNDLLRVLNKVKELNFSTKKQGLLLIRCCTELLPDESATSRMDIVEHIWTAIKPHTMFEVEHYNELLRVYLANKRTLAASTFIHQMGQVKPNITTYELILKALAEAGDINQATEVISNMKSMGLPATENIFNALIICQGKSGNLQNVKEVLTMMHSLKLEPTADTHTAVLQALAWNKKCDHLLDEMHVMKRSGVTFGEKNIMELVKTLAAVGAYGPMSKVLKFLPEETLSSPSISPYMQSVCTLLVFQNHPVAALEIYKCLPLPSFGPKDDQGLHGRSLVRDCVKAAMPSSTIGLITQELMASGRNPIALQNASEAALQLGKVPLALDLFMRMKQLGMPIRPHYFWPILLHNSKSYGEKGILNTLSTMMTMDVKPDYDTIMEYTLPYVSFTSPQNLMKKFLETGLTVTMVLTPMMETLLNTGQVRAASEICELFKGKVDVEKILKPLLKGYLISGDVKSTVHILEDVTNRAIDKNKDWVGRFLCVFMQHKKVKEDLTDFLGLAKVLKSVPLKISTSAADYCLSRLQDNFRPETISTFRDTLIDITDDRLHDEGDMFTHQIPHPKHMDEESLRAHLFELEAKGMNTRGVLRKLLQQYCKEGNLQAAREIATKCQKEGVFLSAGMKAAIFDLHVKLGELDLAEIALADLNKTSPNFTLDEYKVVDFATLMVYRKKISEAFDLITDEAKKRRIMGGKNISMNCWRLLDAMSAHATHTETRRMFETLTSLRYCKPSNVLLGPLIRAHLKNDNLNEAVQEYIRLSHKYNCTPLKHELLCKILWSLGDGGIEENFIANEKSNGRLNKLAETVLTVDKKIHGPGDVQLTLISALAEVGYKKTLRKVLLDPTVKFHPDALMRRCERFADEGKAKSLENIAECAKDLRHIDTDQIYDMVMDIYERTDDCPPAMVLWTKLQEADVTPSQKFVRNLCALIKSNNRPIPPELSVLLEKETKKVTNP